MECSIILGDGPVTSTARAIYLPIIATPPTPPDDSGLSPACAEFLRLLTSDERQQRVSLTVCSSLMAAAELRAWGLANGDPFAHVDRYGVTPNEYAEANGCRLPDGYAEHGNNIESLAAGTGDPAVAFEALAGSPKHADHLFGRGWFGHQAHVGIAMAEGGQYGFYWCVMIGLCLEVTSGA